MKIKMFTGIMVGALLATGSCFADEVKVDKPVDNNNPPKLMVGPQFCMHSRPMNMPPRMRRPEMTIDQALERLQKDYGYTEEELKPYVKSGRDFRRMSSSCHLARLSGEPLAKVVALSQKMTSGRVRYNLGLTPKVYFEKQTAWEAAKLAKELSLPEAELLKLLRSNYSAGEIKMAATLGAKANKSPKQVLKMKTAANSWEMVAGKLNIDQNSFESVKKEIKLMPDGPRRSGAGFADIHMRNPSKKYMLSILNKDYGFTTIEISPLFDKYGFQQLEQLCLYAHFAKKPLAKVVPLRDKYTWEGIKLALGLDAEKYTQAAIQFHARRLQERQNIPTDITVMLMEKGYSLHHINTAYKYSSRCNKTIEEIIALKTPNKRWDKVAEECGIEKSYANTIKKSITDTMGRYGQ